MRFPRDCYKQLGAASEILVYCPKCARDWAGLDEDERMEDTYALRRLRTGPRCMHRPSTPSAPSCLYPHSDDHALGRDSRMLCKWTSHAFCLQGAQQPAASMAAHAKD